VSLLFINSSADQYGADRSMLRTIKALKHEYDGPVFAILPYDGPLVKLLRDIDVQVEIMDLAAMRRKDFNPLGIGLWVFTIIVALLKVSRIVKKHNIKLIHTNTSSVFVGGVISRVFSLVHLWHIREIIIRPKPVANLIRFFYRHFSTGIWAVSKSTLENLVQTNTLIRQKAFVLHNGIDPKDYYRNSSQKFKEKLKLPEACILVGMIGRISTWKGQDLFLKVAHELRDEEIYFLALGSPFHGQEYLLNDFRLRAEALSLGNKFIIHSFDQSVSKYLEAFDVFVLPSTQPDPFPTTVLEAMSHSKAIVANGHGGVLDMIKDGEEGLLTKVNDPFNMAEKIKKLASDKEMRMNLGTNARKRFEKDFTFATYKENFLERIRPYLKKIEAKSKIESP